AARWPPGLGTASFVSGSWPLGGNGVIQRSFSQNKVPDGIGPGVAVICLCLLNREGESDDYSNLAAVRRWLVSSGHSTRPRRRQDGVGQTPGGVDIDLQGR